MNNEEIKKAIETLKENSPKRNFKQSVDLIVALKDINIKKTDHQIEVFVPLHYGLGKQIKVCALVGPELKDEAIKVCDKTITAEEFEKYDKKKAKKLAQEYDVFIAQANIMAKVATAFGRIFGPKGKMPNPKAGCVVPPKTSLKPLYDRLQKTVKVSTKKVPMIQCTVGNESSKPEEIIDNIQTIYNALIHNLPGEKNNIKKVMIKLTMSKPIIINN